MNLQQLRYVRALAEEGSFVAAASRCAVTQPTLSNGIAQLEADLGHRIFRRTTRSVAMTTFGERLLPTIVETLNAFERVRAFAKQSEKSLYVKIGISLCVGIGLAEQVFEPAKKELPNAEFIYYESTLQDLCEQMKRGQLDIILAPLDLRTGAVPDASLHHIHNEPMLFIPRRDRRFRWSDVSRVAVKDIAGEQFVLVPTACGLTQLTKRLFDQNGCKLNRYLGEASNYRTIAEWVDLGLGSGILPQSKIPRDALPFARPIVENGQTAMIEYVAIGKPNTIPPALFAKIWEIIRATPASEPTAVPAEAGFDWGL